MKRPADCQRRPPSLKTAGRAIITFAGLRAGAAMNQKLPVAQALTDLQSSSSDERDAAFHALFNTPFAEIAAAPVSALIRALDHPNEGLRDRIVTALGKKGDREAVPFLIALLPYSGSSVRNSVTVALEQIGLPANLDFLTLLDTTDPGLRHAAVIFLGKARERRAVPAIMSALTGDPSENLRCDAADALSKIGAPAAVPALTTALHSGADPVEYQAFLALKNLGAPARPALIEALAHPNARIRRAAAKVFVSLQEPRSKPLETKEPPGPRFLAPETLPKGPPPAQADPAALPGLRLQLQDSDVGVRISAVGTLSSWIGLSSDRGLEGVVPALEFALNDKAPGVRQIALKSLVGAGGPSRLPLLFSFWSDPDDDVHRAAADELRRRAKPADAPFFVEALHDSRPNRRASAASIIGIIGRQSEIPALLVALEDENGDVRKSAIEALAAIGATSAVSQVIAALDRALAERNSNVCRAAAQALGRFADSAAVPVLGLALDSQNFHVRLAAANALGAIGSPSALPSLAGILADPDTLLRVTAAKALAKIGDPAALLALQHHTSDHTPVKDRALHEPSATIPLVSEAVKQASTDIWRSRALKTVQISAHYPKEVTPHVWHSAHLYIFAAVAAAQVAADIRAQLGRHVDEYRSKDKLVFTPLKEGIAVRVTPLLDGFEFNPAFHIIQLYEPWHRVDFRLRAAEECVGKAANGAMLISVDGAAVADVSMSIYVGAKAGAPDPVQQTATPIESIFCSYSHQDENVVLRVERACRALGIDYLRDSVSLKSGEKWNDALLTLISQAHLFQLFWSGFAAASPFVDKEWRHAYSLRRDAARFIRPVFWAQPMPAPPGELANLHFAYSPELLE